MRSPPGKRLERYTSPTQGTSRAAYATHIQRNLGEMNAQIPLPGKEVFRLVMYNVNYIRDVHNKLDNLKQVTTDLSRLQPTVVALHRVPMASHGLRESLDTLLTSLGYSVQIYHRSPKATFGTMLAARVKLKDVQSKKLDSGNELLMAAIPIGQSLLAVVVARTRGEGPAERRLKRFLTKLASSAEPYDHILVALDHAGGRASQEDWGGMERMYRDIFYVLRWREPLVTMWRDEVHDLVLYKGRSTRVPGPLGAYQFLTLGTSHLPLVVDLHVPDMERIVMYYRVSKGALVLLGGAILLLLLTTGIGVYHWVRAKIDPVY